MTIQEWLTREATTGRLLRFRRLSNGWSLIDVARADGRWEWQAVDSIETMRSVPTGDVWRYLKALAKLGGE